MGEKKPDERRDAETLAAKSTASPPTVGPDDETGSIARDARPDSEKTPRPHTTPGAHRGDYVPTFAASDRVAERYQIISFIAKGGMGEVYEALDEELNERVALKVVRGELAEQEGTGKRFKREIQLSRKVSHPNVCRVFDLGRHHVDPTGGAPAGEVLFLTMELLHGETLAQRLKRSGGLSPEDALPIVRQVARALATGHEAGIVHRDLKSSNIMLVPGKAGERAVVTDFGLARGESDSLASLSVAGDVLGTPAYMAPEQVEGSKVGPAADIYALGVVMFEMITGKLPFPGESPLSIAVKRLKEKPPSPRSLVSGLDPKWESAILRCLERNPADRFAHPIDVVKALEGMAVPRGQRRRRWAIATAAFGLLAAALLLVRYRSAFAPEPATTESAPGSSTASPVTLRRAVAVLGFKNLGRAEADWMSTAVAEMLRTELAAGGGIRGVPGETVARMRLELALAEADSLAADTLLRIRKLTGADYVILGSYLALAKDKLRIDLRLQDTAKGELLASSAAEGSEAELFTLVSAAGLRLRAALGLGEVAAIDKNAVRAAFPSSPAAAQLYSEGLSRLRLFDALEARARLAKAAEAEPGHPLIHAALASAWQALGYDGLAKEESQRAFELAKDLPREDRLAVQALHYETTADWDKAVETYKALLVFFPDRLDYGLRLVAALASAGKGREALEAIRPLRALPAPDSEDPRIDLAEATAAKAMTDFPLQLRAAQAAAAKATSQGAKLLLAQARLAEGTALVNLGRLEEARRACEAAGEIFAAAGDGGNLARAENVIAVGYARAGDMKNARARFAEALGAFRKIGDKRGITAQLTNVAMASLRLGDAAEARRLNEESLAVARETGDRSGAARALNNLAKTLEHTNDLAGARRHFEQAIAAFRELGESRNAALAMSNLGEILQRQGELEGARKQFEASAAISREAGASGDAAVTLNLLAKLHSARGDPDAAIAVLDEALALYRGENDTRGEAGALREKGEILEKRGDKEGGRRLKEQAGRIEAEAKGGR